MAGTGITQSAGLISVWADQSGNGNDLTQTTDANKPTATVDNDGRSVVRFQSVGTADLLTNSLVLNARSYTIWIVVARYALNGNVVGVTGYANAGLRIIDTTQPWAVYRQSTATQLWVPRNPTVAGIRSGASAAAVYNYNNTAAGGALTNFTATGMTLAGSGDYYEVLVYDAAQSDEDAAATRQYLIDTYSLESSFSKLFALEGDSKVSGYASSNNRDVMSGLDLPDWFQYRLSSSGSAIQDLIDRAATLLDPLIDAGRRNVLTFEIGFNDLNSGGKTAQQLYDLVVTYVQARVAAGWEVWPSTMIDCTNTTVSAKIATLNALLRHADFLTASGATGIVDVAADPIFDPGSAADGTYYDDGTHLTDAGTAEFARVITDAFSAPVPGDITFSDVTSTTITATTTATDAGGLASTPFVYHNITLDTYSEATSTPVTFTSLTPNTEYQFEVGVMDSVGNWATSTTYATTTLIAPDLTPPTPGSITFSDVTATSITASSTGATDETALATLYLQYHATSTGYDVYSGVTSSPWIVGSLTPNTSYSFEVGVQDAAGNWATSTIYATTTLAVPVVEVPAASTPSVVSSGSTLARRMQMSQGSPTPPPLSLGHRVSKWPSLVAPLYPGLSSAQVTTLQQMLALDPTIYPNSQITGYYGPLTKAAVARFQEKYGIATTPTTRGLAGPATRSKLNEVYVVIPQLQSQLEILRAQLAEILRERAH